MIVGSNILAGASGQQGYFLNRSVRLRSSASAYLNRTVVTASSRTTWTWSGWVKRGALVSTVQKELFGVYVNSTNFSHLYFDTTETLNFVDYVSSTVTTSRISTAVYRDPSAWYHIVLTYDTTNATAQNRIRIYVNGVEITSFSGNITPAQNYASGYINSINTHYIGTQPGSPTYYCDGYLAEVNFIDGQALTPTSFGAFNPVTGVWQPNRYIGTYGTNGFYLPFNNTNTNLTGNLITYSEDFSNASWTKYQATITADATTAPNGTTTADKIIATVTPQDHLVYKTFTAADNTTYCLSVYAKNAGYDLCRLYIMNKAGSPIASDFFLSTQTFTAGAGCTCAIVSVGNGWYRCSVSLNVGTGATATPNIYIGTNTGATNGDGTSGIFIWGAQFEQNSSVGSYFATGSASTPNSYSLGADQSLSTGGYNSFITNNISLTAGITYDSMTDVPTLTSPTTANYPVLNSLIRQDTGYTTTISAANLNASITYSSGANMVTIPVTMSTGLSGKWYFEVTATSTQPSGGSTGIGISTVASSTVSTNLPLNSYIYVGSDGSKTSYTGTAVNAAYGASYTTNDVIGVALDIDAGTLTFYKNNTTQGIAFTGLAAANYFPIVSSNGTGTRSYSINCGQRPFSYTPPTGFVALNTYNLPAPTISNGANQMNAIPNSGSGTTRTDIVAFQPDFVWTKTRNTATNGFNIVQDSVRGAGNRLITDGTYAEAYDVNYGSFNSTGFTFGSNLNVNTNGNSYIDWFWKAGGIAVTNTSGSISSQVSANLTAGFSIVGFNSGAAGNKTVGHGLGVAPSFWIIKTRNAINSWSVGTRAFANPQNTYVSLNLTTAGTGGDTRIWANAAPTSSVLSFESGYSVVASSDCIAYLFAEIAGYSKFSSYTGNGSTDGTFTYTGFRPRWLMIKRSDSADNWVVYDTSRSTFNESKLTLYPNLANAESADATGIDILSNGFKMRNTFSSLNVNGGTYIYAAFAENPTKFALAR